MERRFPETHPGKVFTVSKIIVNGQQSLKKSATEADAAPASAPAPEALRRAASRDVMGRLVRSDEYASRMARIREKHALPIIPARKAADEGVSTGAVQGRYVKTRDARLALVSNSPLIRGFADLARMEKLEREAVRRKHGALSVDLARKLERPAAQDSFDVTIEFVKEHPGFISSKASLEARKKNAAAWARSRPLVSAGDFARREGLRSFSAPEGGAQLTTRASRAKLLELARREDIVSIFEAKPVETTTIPGSGPADIRSLVTSAYNPPGTMTHYGNRNVATMEVGLSSQYVSCVDPGLQPVAYDSFGAPRSGGSGHSEATYNLLAVGTPGSYRRHYATWGYFGMIVQDIIDDGIDVITTSFINPWATEIQPDARIVDAFSYIAPYPMIVLPAGNKGHDTLSGSQTYNSLVAGNVQHYDNSHYTVDFLQVPFGGPYVEQVVPASQSRNPAAKYGGDDDWELPTLVAPGFSPDSWWGMYSPDSCVHGDTSGGMWYAGGGTSFSSPVLGAMAANVHGAFGNTWHPVGPMQTRAALLVTAQNVDGYMGSSSDERDGMGTVSGSNAVIFARNATSVQPGDPPVVDGIAFGIMDSADFAGWSPRTYHYKAPASFPSGKHLRIVLTWTSSPGVNVAENELSDLALEATTDNWTRYTDRLNGNVEVLDILEPSNNLAPNGEYEITIYPWTFRKASDGPDELQYSLAWTWVKSEAD